MKKLLIALIFIGMSITSVEAQWKTYTDGFNFNNLSGTDTAFYYNVFESSPKRVYDGLWSVGVLDDLIKSDSLHVTIGVASEVGDFKELSITNWPYELGTDSTIVNGSYSHGHAAYDDIIPFRYLVVKYYKDATGEFEVAVTSADSVRHKIYMFER